MSFQLSFVGLDQTYAELETDNNFDVSFMSGSAIQVDANSGHSQIPQRTLLTTQSQINVYNFPPWTPSKKLENLKNQFENINSIEKPILYSAGTSKMVILNFLFFLF